MASKRDLEYRKKKRVRVHRDAPFPVPISTITGTPSDENFWFNFTGYLQHNSVIVCCSGDIKYLHKMGFFGRGLLSRGAAEFHQSTPYVYLPTDPRSDPSTVNIMRRRMYLRHKQWQKLQGGNNMDVDDKSELDLEFDSDNEYFQDRESQEENIDKTETAKQLKPVSTGTGTCIDDIPESKVESWDMFGSSSGHLVKNKNNERENEVSRTVSEKDNYLLNDWKSSEADLEFWSKDPENWNGGSKMLNKDGVASDWDNCEADEDFWGTPVPSTSSGHGNHHKDDNLDLENNCHIEGHKDENRDCMGTSGSHGYKYKFDKVDLEKDWQGHEMIDQDDCPPYKKRKISAIQGSITDGSGRENICDANVRDLDTECNTQSDCERKGESITDFEAAFHLEGENCFLAHEEKDRRVLSDPSVNKQTLDFHESKQHLLDNNHGIINKECEETFKDHKVETCDERSKTFLSNEVNEFQQNDNDQTSLNDLSEKNLEANLTENEIKDSVCENLYGSEVKDVTLIEREIHPYCEVDDDDGDYLIIDDSDVEDHMTFDPNKIGYHWKPVLKKDPFPYTEPLVLSSEEAFFLSYGLGCLSVIDEDRETALNPKELWQRFCQQPRFLPCYTAYHYFRSRGWVPKPGVIFGTDFILYKEGPPFFHGSYSIIVKAVHSGSYRGVEEFANRAFTWTSFSGLHRITEHVAKSLLVCYVIIPSDFTEDEKLSPMCLSKLRIQLQKYSRWVSSQEREADKVTDMP